MDVLEAAGSALHEPSVAGTNVTFFFFHMNVHIRKAQSKQRRGCITAYTKFHNILKYHPFNSKALHVPNGPP